jgi:hypothetical protein
MPKSDLGSCRADPMLHKVKDDSRLDVALGCRVSLSLSLSLSLHSDAAASLLLRFNLPQPFLALPLSPAGHVR